MRPYRYAGNGNKGERSARGAGEQVGYGGQGSADFYARAGAQG